jgi:hypothetical protein
MQEGIQLPELMQKIKALREAGPRAEHVAFSFMKRRVQPLMARDTLGYQYMGDEDTSSMPRDEVDDDDIVERLGKIFKDVTPYTPCLVLEYSVARPPNKVSDCDLCLLSTDWLGHSGHKTRYPLPEPEKPTPEPKKPEPAKPTSSLGFESQNPKFLWVVRVYSSGTRKPEPAHITASAGRLD